MGVTFDNLDVKDDRARGLKDTNRVGVSFDEGKTWKAVTLHAGPTKGRTETACFADCPKGTRKALVRCELSGNNTIGILSFRVDADYKDPVSAKEFRPFGVVYRWKEDGVEKTDHKTMDKLPFTYQIDTAATTEMVSVSYEMPSK